jgi:hypothetical protein
MRQLIFLMLLMVGLVGCQAKSMSPRDAMPAESKDISPELRDTLAGMARSHDQKVQLAFYEALQSANPFNTKDPAIHGFFVAMGKRQAELLSDLQGWASKNQVNLTYRAGTGLMGRGQAIEEGRQSKEIQAAKYADFQRLALIQMYMDYDWQVSLIQATLPAVKDEGLKAYLEKSLKVHEAGVTEVQGLLKKYKYVP